MSNQTIVQEVNHLLSTGQRASISTKTFEKIIELLEQKEKALDEIEENIKAMNNECFYDDICECNNCDMKNGCTYYRKFNILNIINKAKGGVNGNT